MNPRDADHRHDRNAAQAAAEAPVDSERKRLLDKRRAKQISNSKRRSNWTVVFATMLIASAVPAFLAMSSMQVLKVIGLSGDDSQKASQVDLKVEDAPRSRQELDFSVPKAPPAKQTAADSDSTMDKQVQDIRKETGANAQRNNGSDVPVADVQKLLDSYRKEVLAKVEEGRERAETENARFRAAALRLEEERNSAQREAERRRELEEISAKQRQSNGVVVDDSGALLASGSEVKTSVSRALPDPSHTVLQGTIISAVLETAIHSELPGNVRAQVVEPVFAVDGSRVLLPAGTSLIGTVGDRVQLEQRRVLIAWNRAITPDAKSIELGSAGADLLGRAGTEGNVDNRYGEKIGAGLLFSVVTAVSSTIPALVGSNSSSNVSRPRDYNGGAWPESTNATGQAASNVAATIGGQARPIVDEYLSLPPLIRVPQGEEVRVFVNRDLVLR
ncbi:TrbI/VirB10 family protein (plasmid) [Bradyrhizobium sp. 183]|uniref:TrbI/VirB10 family protein n=1 Tax=unclassified Bradyrhizobium TaxID=2631580 RepID=UPI001FFF1988|nr:MULTISPECIES: TrbI/VirB10 family protein [unclassified Bradyrhizobium]UPJ84957.1 TrbI/VirB10 family protein [Bradyrhizobium sp. 184]UPJ92747.1 TrbI/VirB10 family protein [Bradyrhizobium sp. 183]